MVWPNAIAIVLLTYSLLAPAQVPSPVDRNSDRNEILTAIAEISRAYVARNPEPFQRLYLENFASIRGRPVYNSRDQLIAMMQADSGPLKAGKKLDFDTISYESENPQIHFYGRSAIVNIAKKNLWQYRGSKCLTRTQSTELWLKVDGSWRLGAGQSTSFQCEAKPYYPIHPAVAAIPSITKAPVNSDLDAEGQIRAIVNEIAGARSGGDEALRTALEKYLVEDLAATNIRGEVVNDRSSLALLPIPAATRLPGLRNQDDAVQVYAQDAAIYTFRVRPAATPAAAGEPQQCTIFFVRVEGRWQIAATHLTKMGSAE